MIQIIFSGAMRTKSVLVDMINDFFMCKLINKYKNVFYNKQNSKQMNVQNIANSVPNYYLWKFYTLQGYFFDNVAVNR